ncbi:TIGR02186 family protein [Thermopetrobacter sp. TC1]|uniref:TIGR02186 family protein n=1 Tax=Thermopetrobacter sp. TC1 TaxID=1495045 RepID=UPI00068A50D8|nr:TIGR02186 family protein [Thermopetrobacter sp. TC1]
MRRLKRTVLSALIIAGGFLVASAAPLPAQAQEAKAQAQEATETYDVRQPEGQGKGMAQGAPVSVRLSENRNARKNAPKVVADLSTHTVAIKTDFAGTRVMLFGAIVGTAEEGKARPDLIVVIRGPSRLFKMHRKKRVGPIWVNADERIFRAAPGYYALLSSNILTDIAPADRLKKRGIGFEALQEHLLATAEGFKDLKEAELYAKAFVRLMKKKGLYRANDNGVNFTGRYLFRATFDLPANVPLGEYEADVYLWRAGKLLGKFTTKLEIEKRGFERLVYVFAHEQPLLYGIAAVIIAIAAGFTAAAIFRKD